MSSKMKVGLWAMTLITIGCAGNGSGEAEAAETLRASVGMAVEEFNGQPFLKREAKTLSPDRTEFIAISAPHILEIALNGRELRFYSGGGSARTFVGNSFIAGSGAATKIHKGRISTIRFDMNRELVSLPEALQLAAEACAGVEAAGLAAREGEFVAVVTEQLGAGQRAELPDHAALRSAFTDPKVRAVVANLCRHGDGSHKFEVEITNYRRAKERFGGSGEEADLLRERAYRVSGSLLQNLD